MYSYGKGAGGSLLLYPGGEFSSLLSNLHPFSYRGGGRRKVSLLKTPRKKKSLSLSSKKKRPLICFSEEESLSRLGKSMVSQEKEFVHQKEEGLPLLLGKGFFRNRVWMGERGVLLKRLRRTKKEPLSCDRNFALLHRRLRVITRKEKTPARNRSQVGGSNSIPLKGGERGRHLLGERRKKVLPRGSRPIKRRDLGQNGPGLIEKIGS